LGVGFVVIALHGLCGLAWVVLENEFQLISSVKRSPPIVVWLPPLENTKRVPPKTAKEVAPGIKRETVNKQAQLPASEMPAIEDPSSTVVSTASIDAYQTQGSSLNLTLSRKDLKALNAPTFASQSAFHAGLPKSVEGKIAEAFSQSGPWVEERIDDDHIRMRKGTMCVTVERSLTAKLDAFSDYARRLLWNASTPYKCQ
jgi:hypothetical protein